MTLLAYGSAIDSNAIVGVELDQDGNLVVSLELEVGEERHTLPASHVAPAVRALAMSPGSECAA